MSKVTETLEDMTELRKAVESLRVEQRDTAECLLIEITFLHNTLEELKDDITVNGAIITTRRGQSKTIKENPALKSYNTSVMRYSQLLKQLTDLLPEAEKTVPTDPLIDFVKG